MIEMLRAGRKWVVTLSSPFRFAALPLTLKELSSFNLAEPGRTMNMDGRTCL